MATTEPTTHTKTIHQEPWCQPPPCCSRCTASKATNSPTLPTRSSLSACCVGLSFSSHLAPVDGWLLGVAINHPLRAPLSSRARCPTPGSRRRRPPCDHLVAIAIACHHVFAAPVNDWLLFVASLSLHPLPLSSTCLLSSSTHRAIVDEAAQGQSPMQSPPIFVEMEPAIIRHRLALRLALAAACQQAAFWCVSHDGE